MWIAPALVLENQEMNRRRIALRSFRDLCAFVGLMVLVSYFYNWTVDTRHWYVTLASAFVCSVLWLGFYVLEAHRDAVTRVSLTFARVALRWLSRLRTKPAESRLPTTVEPEEKLIT